MAKCLQPFSELSTKVTKKVPKIQGFNKKNLKDYGNFIS